MGDAKPGAPPKADAAAAAPALLFPLRKPIQAHGDELTALAMREPTGGDIDKVGNPVILDMFSGDTPKIMFDAPRMTMMMATLAAVPPSSIRSMDPRDWSTVAYGLANFFVPDLSSS